MAFMVDLRIDIRTKEMLNITEPNQKGCFPLFCPYSNQSSATKGVFLKIYFSPYSNQSPATKGVFLYFCPYSNQSPIVRGDRGSRANLMPIYGDLYQIKL